jgi:hypothetical protein
MKQTYTGDITTKFIWVIPILLGVSESSIDSKSEYVNKVYALHITPLFEIGFNWRKKK